MNDLATKRPPEPSGRPFWTPGPRFSILRRLILEAPGGRFSTFRGAISEPAGQRQAEQTTKQQAIQEGKVTSKAKQKLAPGSWPERLLGFSSEVFAFNSAEVFGFPSAWPSLRGVLGVSSGVFAVHSHGPKTRRVELRGALAPSVRLVNI